MAKKLPENSEIGVAVSLANVFSLCHSQGEEEDESLFPYLHSQNESRNITKGEEGP